MKYVLTLPATVMFMACIAVGQNGDLGAQIAAENAELGASPGEIHVTASGIISEGKVSLSAGHDLVCDDHTTISLKAGSYLYQNSHTRIRNCIISSTSTPINGEIQSKNTDHVELDNVTFVGGGNLVYWFGVSDFLISDNKVVSVTAFSPVTEKAQSGYYLLHCSRGQVNNLRTSGFVFPTGPRSIPAILGLYLSRDITVNNIFISHVDASYAFGGSGIQIGGSKNITVNGGVITYNAKMDGITVQSFGQTTEGYGLNPSYGITITGLNASYNGGQGLNTRAGLSLGDAIDVINTGHVRISNCILLGSGYIRNQQPAIWLFLDDDVVVENSDMSDSSMGGIDLAGSLNVRLVNNSINRNQASGTFSEAQIGTATSSGSTVTFVGGVSGSFGLAWRAGTPFILDGITYEIASVPNEAHVVLASSPPNHPSPVSWVVNSANEEMIGDVINDNGLGKFGGQNQVGISWADGTNGIISGVTAIDTGAGTQLYGLEFANTASAMLSGDTFSPNVEFGDGIFGSPQAVSPTNVSFPDQAIGTTSSSQTVTLTAGAVHVQNLLIQVSGDFSETNNCGRELSAFGTCQVQVNFAPTVAGSLNGTLTLTDSAPYSPQTVLLTGQGSTNNLTASPTSFSFPSQLVGTTSSTQTLTLTAGVVAVGNLLLQTSGVFSETNNCGTGLAALGTCQVLVSFTPTNSGPQSGTLTITDSAPNSPQTISLTGTGASPGLALGIAPGGSRSATIAAGTTATYSLSIGGAGISGTASLSCTGAPTGATCVVPATEAVSATTATDFNVSVTTTSSTTGALRQRDFRQLPWLWASAVMGWVMLPGKARTKRSALCRLWWLPLLLLTFLCSCGGGSNGSGGGKSGGTPAGNYTLTVTAAVGSTSQPMSLTLTVQ